MDNLPDTYDFWDKYRENYNAYDKVMLVKYGSRTLYLDDSTNAEDSYAHFKELFNSFLEGSAYEYQRKWDALKAEYNPIENYDRNESTTTTTDAKTDTVHNPQVKVTASGGTVTVEDETNPYDDNYVKKAKSTTVQPSTNTVQDANDVRTDYGQDTVTINGHIHGNIGTVTNQSMITAELELRSNVFIYEVIHDIINNIAYF